MSDNKTNYTGFKFLSEGIFIIVLTAGLYLIAYNYYIGFCSFFTGSFDIKVGILDYYRNPSIFTDLSIYKLISLSYKVALIVLSSISIAALILLLIKKENKYLLKAKNGQYTLSILLLMVILTVIPAIKLRLGIDTNTFNFISILSFFPLIMIFSLEIVFPFLAGLKEKGIGNKIRQGQKELYADNILSILFKKYYIIFILFIIFGAILPFSAQMGYIDGANKVEYFVINKDQNTYALIDTDGENYFVVSFDKSTKTFKSNFKIISIDTIVEEDLSVGYETIGPLHR